MSFRPHEFGRGMVRGGSLAVLHRLMHHRCAVAMLLGVACSDSAENAGRDETASSSSGEPSSASATATGGTEVSGGAGTTGGETSADLEGTTGSADDETTPLPDPSSGEESSDGPMASQEYAREIQVAVHDQVKTILVVTWEQAIAADRVWLAFSFEGGESMTSRAHPGGTGTHRDVVLGVPGETEVEVSIVSEIEGMQYVTTPHMGTTGAVPASMPVPTVLAYEAELASPDRFLLGAVEDSADDVGENLFSYLSYQAWLYVMDRQGRIVWYYNDPSRNSPMGFPRIARDGEYLIAEESRVGGEGRILRMTLDREYFDPFDLPGLADAIDVTDDGTLLFDVGRSGELHERTPDGTDRAIWSCEAENLGFDNCYSNTINWNAVEDSVFMSFPEPGAVVEIDRATGTLIGHYGNQAGAWEFAPPLEAPPEAWRFGFQHFPNLTPQGTLLVSSHMPGYEAFEQTPTPNQHAFVEFAIDRGSQTLTEVWRYTEGPEWPRARGMAIRLANGNTLANYGTAGVIREITPDKQTAFHVKFDIPTGDDNYNKLVGHNFFVDDLYALNGGPL